MRFFQFICVYLSFFAVSVAQDSSSVLSAEAVLKEKQVNLPDYFTERKELPGILAVFVHRHFLDSAFNFRLSPDVLDDGLQIGGLLPERTYTMTLESEKDGLQFNAMSTLFPSTRMGDISIRKQVCYVEFTELSESYEILIFTIENDKGKTETSVFWKKLPSDIYEHAHFKWISGVEVRNDNEQIVIFTGKLDKIDTTVEIINQAGRTLKAQVLPHQDTVSVVSINTVDKGIYLVLLKTGSRPFYAKLIQLGAI